MKQKAVFYVVLSGILWGTSGLFVNALSPFGLSSLHMATIRGTVAAICMILYALVKKRDLFRLKLSQLVIAAASGFAMFMTSACYFSSIQASSVSTAVVLMYTAPVIVMIYSVLFLGENLTRLKVISVIMVTVGCSLISGVIGGLKFSVLGILYGFASGIGYALYNIFTKIQMRNGCNAYSASMYAFIFMMIFALIASEPVHILNVACSKMQSIPFMLGCGLLTSVLPYFLYTIALKDLPVGTASALSIVEPMAATIFSIAFLGENLSIYSACGIILIIFSIFLLSKGE